MSEVRDREFYRYVGEQEIEAIEGTGKLRGEKASRDETFWT